MNKKYTNEEAISLLKKYYPKAALKKFDIDDHVTTSDCGDGSQRPIWDLIDLQTEKLLKASDFYDSENGSQFSGEGDEFESEYQLASDKLYDDQAISVETLFSVVLKAALS